MAKQRGSFSQLGVRVLSGQTAQINHVAGYYRPRLHRPLRSLDRALPGLGVELDVAAADRLALAGFVTGSEGQLEAVFAARLAGVDEAQEKALLGAF